jgi:hypothetical protein
MATTPDGADQSELTVVARRVLLDGLTALNAHLGAITVVGGQAVSLRTPSAAVASAAYTSDGDLSIDPQRLGDEPLVDEALRAAGFALRQENQPGLWIRSEKIGGRHVPIELDILVGKTLAPTGKRSVRIAPHGHMSARWIEGLEVAVEDRSPLLVGSLDPNDVRAVNVNVAGPCALLVAKAFKIRDRLRNEIAQPNRVVDKDASDVLRIMMTTPTDHVAATLAPLTRSERVGAVTIEGLGYLRDLFGRPRSRGVDMAVRALTGDIPEDRVRALAPAFVRALP